MGIAKIAYCLLAELKRDYPDLGGSVLQLGRQTVYLKSSQSLSVLKEFGIKPSVDLSPNSQSNINDITLFKSLGFDVVESVDFSDYEKPTHTHDFNLPIPENFHEKYDAIYDGGTTEHIFDFPQCLKNIYKMLKRGGVIMHASPANNYVDHGFYSFSPTVFYDYYTANGFEILKSCIFEVKPSANKCVVYEYDPQRLSSLPRDGFGELLVWFVARKVDGSTCDGIPQQGAYLKTWSKSSELEQVEFSTSPRLRLVSHLKRIIKGTPFLYDLFLRFRRVVGGKKPPIVATYDYL
jgi:hypothetical protein